MLSTTAWRSARVETSAACRDSTAPRATASFARSAAIASRAASILSFAARSRFTVSRAWSRSSRTLLTVFSSASWIWLRYSVLSTRSSNPSAESTTSTRSGLPVSYIATSISRSCTSARFSRARTTSR